MPDGRSHVKGYRLTGSVDDRIGDATGAPRDGKNSYVGLSCPAPLTYPPQSQPPSYVSNEPNEPKKGTFNTYNNHAPILESFTEPAELVTKNLDGIWVLTVWGTTVWLSLDYP